MIGCHLQDSQPADHFTRHCWPSCSAVLHTQPLLIGVSKSAIFVQTTACGMATGT
ncbi:hypothetical protein C2845_PM12G18060 [Panicum miliaceum]|uniref:Uncharacterized protein n=1 Tax=Panicum miliaceum TaxID=4540 RepID=A0A3L6QG20_PANMI|nr:hypothetical protein C2845_PM12G18060 [Panicum miliaceum]